MTAPAKSIRQKIVEAVDTRLKTILTASNYATDLGKSVKWWLSRLDTAALPAIVCRDRLAPPENNIRWRRKLIIEMEIFLSQTSTPDEEMRKALADIETCIGTDVTFGGLADDTELFESEKMTMDDWDSVIVASGFYIAIEFETEPWNPRT
jgi:hypothetical protein